MEVIFDVRESDEGSLHARALAHAIYTGAESWTDLRNNILEAVLLHFEDEPIKPRLIHLHYTRDELIPVSFE